jgi:hypothetical protein
VFVAAVLAGRVFASQARLYDITATCRVDLICFFGFPLFTESFTLSWLRCLARKLAAAPVVEERSRAEISGEGLSV